jgi:hypothetical protein
MAATGAVPDLGEGIFAMGLAMQDLGRLSLHLLCNAKCPSLSDVGDGSKVENLPSGEVEDDVEDDGHRAIGN